MRLRIPKRGARGLPRLRFPTLGPGGQRRLPYGMTPDIMLRGLVKLVAAVVVAGLGGLAIGIALAKLSGDSDDSLGIGAATTTTSALPQPDVNPMVRVRIVSATLQAASTRSGKRRQRARISVHVRVTNRGTERFVPARPVLISGDQRVKTDPNQDSATTNLAALAPGATGDVTLRFETAGAVTERVQRDLRARLRVAGKTTTATVKLGGRVGSAP